MISARHTTNRQSFKKVTCPFKVFNLYYAISAVGLECNRSNYHYRVAIDVWGGLGSPASA